MRLWGDTETQTITQVSVCLFLFLAQTLVGSWVLPDLALFSSTDGDSGLNNVLGFRRFQHSTLCLDILAASLPAATCCLALWMFLYQGWALVQLATTTSWMPWALLQGRLQFLLSLETCFAWIHKSFGLRKAEEPHLKKVVCDWSQSQATLSGLLLKDFQGLLWLHFEGLWRLTVTII